ncbi:hypothetical protein SULYE_1135 [Sulfurihydrogenibium yellowstonense SS-5]|uniref:Uncharacterized protein n=1 Tax=Sulfurihydrogenibium yellowstonense SS-5 TaxID=432331 RepID=C4FKN5_9AQUI|nr:hypothetical protein SULYE_1135 [Sulfurihydrogenibium yellowstonense SS-5]
MYSYTSFYTLSNPHGSDVTSYASKIKMVGLDFLTHTVQM